VPARAERHCRPYSRLSPLAASIFLDALNVFLLFLSLFGDE
jgi:hypothetical protein